MRVEMYLMLLECYLSLFSVSVEFLFPLLAEIVFVSKIVECVGDCEMSLVLVECI